MYPPFRSRIRKEGILPTSSEPPQAEKTNARTRKKTKDFKTLTPYLRARNEQLGKTL
jgi:hypothetical protein